MKKIITAQYKKTFWVATLMFVLFVSMYLFGVSRSVFNTVALKDAEIKSSELRSKLAHLEADFVKIDKGIDKQLASDLGFKEVGGTLFSYSGLSSSVSARTQ